jgi:hypothetical protein
VTPSERVQKLEALLARVQRNRTAAPQVGVASPPAAAAPAPMASAPAAPTPEPPAVEAQSVAPAAWAPEPGSGMQQRPVTAAPSLPPEEVSEDDLLEVTTIPPAPSPEPDLEPPPELEVVATTEVSLEAGILEPDAREVSEVTAVGDEQAPVSSSRFRVPASLDDAIASASEAEAEREIPVKTPPPESGPQEALPAMGLEAPRTPDIEQLEADLDSPPSMGPTAEQLGETIELEPPRGPELEIDITVEEEAPAASVAIPEELEVALPRPSLPSGLYDVTAPPPAAYPGPALAEEAPSVQAPPAPLTVPGAAPAAEGPDRTGRPALGATDVAEVKLGLAAVPRTFVEVLDASLGA